MATQWTGGLSALTPLPAATLNTIGAAWESYTPTLTQSGAVTKTVTYAKYTQINKLCICNVRLDVTGAGTGSNAVAVGLPLTSAAGAGINIGIFQVYDASPGISYAGNAKLATTTTVNFTGDWSANSYFGAVPNIALASGDQILISVMYEVA